MFPHFTTSSLATIGHVLAWEINPSISRKAVTVLAGSGSDRSLKIGTVMGARLFGAPVIAAKAGGNTGNGALGSLGRRDGCKVGVYTLTCIAAAANGGRFEVLDPDGYRMGDALAGVAYVSPQIGFTVSDGSADFVVGDGFTVTIPEGDGKVVGLDPSATDGTQLADCVLLAHVTAPDGADAPSSALNRLASVLAGGLIWPDGIPDVAKAAAIARLDHDFLTVSTSVVA